MDVLLSNLGQKFSSLFSLAMFSLLWDEKLKPEINLI